MSERYARRARRDAVQYLIDRVGASWTMHRLHPDEGWDCAAEELAHLARVVKNAPHRPETTVTAETTTPQETTDESADPDPRTPG